MGRITAIVAGLAAAVIAVNANAGFTSGAPMLTATGEGCSAQACSDLFAGAGPLAPGVPVVRQVRLTYSGPAPSREAGLFFSGYVSRSGGSSRACTAVDPGAQFDFTVSQGAAVLYRGTLAGFAAAHHDAATRLALAGPAGTADRWSPGDSTTLTMAVALDRSAGNSLMGCTVDTQFSWFAE